MPTPGKPTPPPAPRRARRRAGETLSLPSPAPPADKGNEPAALPPPVAAPEEASEAPPPAGEVGPPGFESSRSSFVVPEVRRRRRTREQLGFRRPPRLWSVPPVLIAIALLVAMCLGAGLGWSTSRARPRAALGVGPGSALSSATTPFPASPPLLAGANTPADSAAAVETAYAALEAGRTEDARDRFLALATRADPATRVGPALRAAAAWCELSAGHSDAAEGLLVAGLGRTSGGESADTRYLLGLSQFLRGEHAEAEQCFARAAALDPTRPDVHLLWGEVLRRQGHPRESVAHFRAALRRNRQETSLGYYRLKLWLAQLQAGGADAAEAEAAIADALRAGGAAPGGSLLLAAAAGDVTHQRWSEAAGLMRAARPGMEPAVFAVVLQDPLFAEERGRPELREFFPAPSGGGGN